MSTFVSNHFICMFSTSKTINFQFHFYIVGKRCLAKFFTNLDTAALLIKLDPTFNNFSTSSIIDFLVDSLVIFLVDSIMYFFILTISKKYQNFLCLD